MEGVGTASNRERNDEQPRESSSRNRMLQPEFSARVPASRSSREENLFFATLCLILTLALSALASGPSSAEDIHLIGVGPRMGIGGDSPLGEEQQEDFYLYDVAATFGLPWSWRNGSDWGLETRLIASAGQLRTGTGESGFIGTLVPGLALDSENWGIAIDVGLGGGLFSNYTFGVQNFGGPFQIVGNMGICFRLYPPLVAGYRFQHFSDAGIYGDGTLGADMHLLELRYRF